MRDTINNPMIREVSITSPQLLEVYLASHTNLSDAIEVALKALTLLAEIIPQGDLYNALAFENLMDEMVEVMNASGIE